MEILIAITLLAFITLGVVNITENAALTMERTTEINRNNLQIETALSRFEWDFSQIYSPLYFSTQAQMVQPGGQPTPGGTNPSGNLGAGATSPEVQHYYEQLSNYYMNNQNFSGISKEGFPIPRFQSPEKDTFEFFTSSNRRRTENTKQSHFAWVLYKLAPMETSVNDENKEQNNIPKGLRNLVRYFNANDPYNPNRIDINSPEIKGVVLLENVESLAFEYWNPNNRKWESSVRNIQGGQNLLRGVRVFITWYDYSGNKRSIQKIFRPNWPMSLPQDIVVPNTTGTTPNPSKPGDENDTEEKKP